MPAHWNGSRARPSLASKKLPFTDDPVLLESPTHRLLLRALAEVRSALEPPESRSRGIESPLRQANGICE